MAKHQKTINGVRATASGGERSLTLQVYEALKQAIIRGDLRPSESINEPGLAEQYGTSKTPIREALRLLVHDGWVVIIPRRGYLVRPLGLEDIREVFALRRMLEPQLAADTARRQHPNDVSRLQDVMKRQRSADLGFDQIVQSAEGFHLALAEMSGNTRSVKIVSGLIEEVVRLTHLMPRLEQNLRSIAELDAHEGITDAIAQGNSEEAADLMRAHLVVAGRGMMQAFIDDED